MELKSVCDMEKEEKTARSQNRGDWSQNLKSQKSDVLVGLWMVRFFLNR
jgi:hypothetical protein